MLTMVLFGQGFQRMAYLFSKQCGGVDLYWDWRNQDSCTPPCQVSRMERQNGGGLTTPALPCSPPPQELSDSENGSYQASYEAQNRYSIVFVEFS